MRIDRHVALVVAVALLLLPAAARASNEANDLSWCMPGPYNVAVTDEVWTDKIRDREVPVRIYSPENAPCPHPVVLFSHGLGGSRMAGEAWGRQWASWGIVCIHMQHAGSDGDAIRAASGTLMERMRSAIAVKQLIARAADVSFTATEAARRAASGEVALSGIDPAEIGCSGHSFGAQTVIAVAGQQFGKTSLNLADTRFRAFIAFSPSVRTSTDIDLQFGRITRPFLSLTGSQDRSAVTPETTPESRTLPFEHMPPGQKYLLWLDTASHMSFSGNELPRPASLVASKALGYGSTPPNQEHIDIAVKGVTTAFWLAYLSPKSERGALAAKWIEGNGPKELCIEGDRWDNK